MFSREEFEKVPTKGTLERTVQDHFNIGSTPNDDLLQNPGKTEADLMSDEKLKKWLENRRKEIERLKDAVGKGDKFAEFNLPDRERDWKLNLEYLRRINRYPQELDTPNPGTIPDINPQK